MKKSWRTSLFGVAVILQAVSVVAKALLDGDPSTAADFNELLTQVLLGAGFLFTKDSVVTGGSVAATAEAAKRVGG